MVDQFGTLHPDTTKSDRLLVPTTKGLGSPPSPPVPGAADHYKCHKGKVTGGTPKFPKGIEVLVGDQFETWTYRVLKPQRLCNPVDENGEGITRPLVKAATGQPKHTRVVGTIHTNNQFGLGRLDTITEEEICVPARTSP